MERRRTSYSHSCAPDRLDKYNYQLAEKHKRLRSICVVLVKGSFTRTQSAIHRPSNHSAHGRHMRPPKRTNNPPKASSLLLRLCLRIPDTSPYRSGTVLPCYSSVAHAVIYIACMHPRTHDGWFCYLQRPEVATGIVSAISPSQSFKDGNSGRQSQTKDSEPFCNHMCTLCCVLSMLCRCKRRSSYTDHLQDARDSQTTFLFRHSSAHSTRPYAYMYAHANPIACTATFPHPHLLCTTRL